LTPQTSDRADVIVVGAGPAGSAAAAYLSRSGLDVLLLDKARFPRPKVCGDGLTPRAVRELGLLGIETPADEGWIRNTGLRLVGGGMRLAMPWPEVPGLPAHGLVRTRADFDEILLRQAQSCGARALEGVHVDGPVVDERTGAVTGVRARLVDERGHAAGPEMTYAAPLVIAADGVASRLALAVGRERRADRPVGVAVRTYFTSPRQDDDHLEFWFDWTAGAEGMTRKQPLPGGGFGYGWVFGAGDGTSNVGVAMLRPARTRGSAAKPDYHDILRRWVATMPAEWTFGEETMTEPLRGAALPMGFNRGPQYAEGLLLVGDAGGMVNPFSGEGIAYALESGRIAAEVIATAFALPPGPGREEALQGYPLRLREELGGYFTLGRWAGALMQHKEVLRLVTAYGFPHPMAMRFALRLLGNLTSTDHPGKTDRVIAALSRMAPAA
jgi:geranylgeranyl reductase family protein